MNKHTTLFSALLTTLLLSACSDGTVSTGGGAGDTEANSLAVALITPLVGLYDLPEDWRGLPVSEAYLEIQDPNDAGTAVTLVHLINTMNNCVEPGPFRGEIKKDPVSEKLFLDSFATFGSSVVSRQGTDLLINLTEDINDIDNDGDVSEPIELQATRLGIMPSDLPQTCQ